MIAIGWFVVAAFAGFGMLLHAAWQVLRVLVAVLLWLAVRGVMVVSSISLRRRAL